jgi:hypothetical protein
MGQLNGTGILKGLFGLFSVLDDTDRTLVKDTLYRQTVHVHVTDGGTAGTAQTATPFFTNRTDANLRVVSATVKTPVAVTGGDTNNATFTIAKVDADGTNAATVASRTTNVAGGNYTAFKPVALTLTAANVVIPPGWSLHAAVSKASSGVAIAAATSQAYVEIVLEPEQ